MDNLVLGVIVFMIIAMSILAISLASIGMIAYDNNPVFKEKNQANYNFMGTAGIGGGLLGFIIATYLIYDNVKKEK
jgi:hypothetical protein